MKRFCLVVCILMALTSAAFCVKGQVSDIPVNSVVIPWEDYSALRDHAKEEVPERAWPYSFEGARYSGTGRVVSEEMLIEFDAAIKVKTYESRNISVPVLSNQIDLESLKVDGKEAAWVNHGEYSHIYINTPGSHLVTARFTVKINARHWPREFELPLVPIPNSEVILEIPDKDVEVMFDPGVAVESVSVDTGERIKGLVPSVPKVNIKWLQANDVKKTVPVKMSALVNTYASLAEQGGVFKTEVEFRILQGEKNFFQIRTPDWVDIIDVVPGDSTQEISQWYTETADMGKTVHIYTPYQQTKKFSARISYEKTKTKSEYSLDIPAILPLHVERYESLVAVGSKDSVEINEETASNVERRDVRFLPAALQRLAGSNALYYYKALDQEHQIRFSVKSHKKAPVAITRVKSLMASSVLTESGTIMTKVTFHINNSQAQFFRTRLPKGARLLSTFLDGREVQPAREGEGYLIPITKSSDTPFSLEIAYLSQTDSMGILGACTLDLPQNDLGAGELIWTIFTPNRYRMFHFGGNIQRNKISFSRRVDMLLGEIDTNACGLAYAGSDVGKSYEYQNLSVRNRFDKEFARKQTWDNEDYYAGMGNQVQVQIPISGRGYSFSSYLVKDYTPEVTIYYFNSTIHKLFGIIGSVIAFMFVFTLLALIMNRSHIPQGLVTVKRCLVLSGLAAGLFLLLIFFSLSITEILWDAVITAVFLFAIWHNQTSRYAHRPIFNYVLGLFFLGLMLFFMFFLFVGEWITIFPLCLIMIIAQVLMKAFFPDKRKMPPAVTTALVIVFMAAGLVGFHGPTPAWAGGKNLPAPSMEATYLHLPLEKFEELLENMENKWEEFEKKPEDDYVFGPVHVTGQINEKFADLHLRVPLAILSEDYVLVPIVKSHISVSKAEFNGKPVPLIENKGAVWFEVEAQTSDKEGTLEIDLTVPVHEKGGVNEFVLRTWLLSSGVLELTIGKEITSVELDGVVWQEREGGKVRAALDNSFVLRGELATFRRKAESSDAHDKRVKKTYSTTYTLVSLEEEIASFFSSIRYQILNDQIREFIIKLPSDVVVHEIVGEDLESWSLSGKEKEVNIYTAKTLYPVENRYDLAIQYEKALGKGDGIFSVPNLQVQGVARDVGFIGVEMRAQSEISIKSMNNARMLDIKELPNIIKDDALAPFVYALRYVEMPFNITFDIDTHPTHEMDPAIADKIQYTYVVSPRGKTLAQAQLWIRNSRKQFLSFDLPKGCKLVSSFLDGKSIKPSVGDDAQLLLPLKRQSQNPFLLEVVFEANEQAVSGFLGKLNIPYPKVDIPASMVKVDIFFPEKVHYFSRSGDLQPDGVSGYIQWRGFELAKRVMARGSYASSVVAPEPASTNFPMDNTKFGSNQLDSAVNAGGTHSLKIDLPKKGRMVTLARLYVPAGQSMRTGYRTCHRFWNTGWVGLSAAMLLALGLLVSLYNIVVFPHREKVLLAILALAITCPISWTVMLVIFVAGLAMGLVGKGFYGKWKMLRKKQA